MPKNSRSSSTTASAQQPKSDPQDAGYEKLIVAGEPLSKKEQNELKNNTLEKAENEIVIPVQKQEKVKDDFSSRIPQDEDWIE